MPWQDKVVGDVQFSDIRDMQRIGILTGTVVFGSENMTNRAERLMRFGEEAIELLQAGDITETQALQLVQYVYGRPKEDRIEKEVAGSLLTLFAVAHAHGVDLVQVFDAEVKRLMAKKDAARTKHANKPAEIRA